MGTKKFFKYKKELNVFKIDMIQYILLLERRKGILNLNLQKKLKRKYVDLVYYITQVLIVPPFGVYHNDSVQNL